MKTTAILIATAFALVGFTGTALAHPLDILGVAYVDPSPEHDIEHIANGEVPEEPPEYSVWLESNDCAGLQKTEAALARDACAPGSEIDTQVA